MLTGRCHRCPMLFQVFFNASYTTWGDARFSFLCRLFLFIVGAASLSDMGGPVTSAERLKSRHPFSDHLASDRHTPPPRLSFIRFALSSHNNLMDIVAEPIYESASPNSEEFVLPYDDSDVAAETLPPEPSLASRIGKTRIYLYSESDAASRLGKVRLQLRRNFR